MPVHFSTVYYYDMLGGASILGQIISLQSATWCSSRRSLPPTLLIYRSILMPCCTLSCQGTALGVAVKNGVPSW